MQVLPIIILVAVLYVISCVRVLNEYERGVVFRLGRVLSCVSACG